MVRFVLLLTFLVCTALEAPLYGQDQMGIYGIVYVVDGDVNDVSLVVYGDGMTPMRIPISKKGKFYFTVPVDQVSFIRCAKPDYLTKRVKIDTHNAFIDKHNSKYNRSVGFDLEMIPQSYTSEVQFEGPVATIEFNEINGLLKITYNYTKARAVDPSKDSPVRF